VTDRALRLRRNPGFRRFWAASTISDVGTQVGAVAIGVLVVADLGGTATDVGLVQSAGVAPYLAVGLFAGVLADRMRRKPLLVGTDLGRALVLACVPLLAVTGILDVPVLAALMVAFGLLSVLNAAAHQSFLPRLLPRELLPRANPRLEQSAAVAQTTGRLLGGGLVAAIGAPLTVLVDAASYAVSGLLTAATPVRDTRPQRASRSVLADLAEGTRWVYRHTTLAPLVMASAWERRGRLSLPTGRRSPRTGCRAG
jgi:MFS family permease